MSGQNDIDIFNQAALLVHASQSIDGLTRHLLTALRLSIPGDIRLVNWIGLPDTPVLTVYDPDDAVAPEINANVHRFLHQHPAYGHRYEEALCISDAMGRARWHRTELYREGFGAAGQEDDIGIDFDFGDGCSLTLGVTRSRVGFGWRERRLLNLLRPHVRLAYERVKPGRETIAPVARLVRGELEMDASGGIRCEDGATRAVLERFFGPGALRGDILPESPARWARHEAAALAARDRPVAPLTCYRLARTDRTLTLSLLPGREPDTHLILVEEHLRLEPPAARALLSAREREVLHWLAQGKSNPEIATILAIGRGTVKRHLENIYAKIGVEGRHGAVMEALRSGLAG